MLEKREMIVDLPISHKVYTTINLTTWYLNNP